MMHLNRVRFGVGASLVAQMVKNLPEMQETGVWSLGWEGPLEKGTATHTSILAWRIPWTEEPRGLQSMGSTKSRTWLSDFYFFKLWSVWRRKHWSGTQEPWFLVSAQPPIARPLPGASESWSDAGYGLKAESKEPTITTGRLGVGSRGKRWVVLGVWLN